MRANILTASLLLALTANSFASCGPPIDPNGYIAKSWSGNTVTTLQAAVNRIAANRSMAAPTVQIVTSLGVGAYLVNMSGNTTNVKQFAADLAADPTMKYFVPNATMTTTPTMASDTWPYQYDYNAHYFPSYQAAGGYDESLFSWTNDPLIYDQRWYGVETLAWNRIATTDVVNWNVYATIAVLDTGYLDHPEFAGRILPGYDFISSSTNSNDGNGRDSNARDAGDFHPGGSDQGCVILPRASSWHGTRVASVAVAAKGNAQGMVGFASDAKLLPVRVSGRNGATIADLSDAIYWTAGGSVPNVPNNLNIPDVINISLGHPGQCDPPLGEAIEFANSRGVEVVVAAGNDHVHTSAFSPASCYGAIAVGAATIANGLAPFSNYGPGTTVVAPGEKVMTLTNLASLQPGTSFDYVLSDGTSFAAPVVSAAIAERIGLERGFRPWLLQGPTGNNYKLSIIDAMISESQPIQCNGDCGAGMINFSATVPK